VSHNGTNDATPEASTWLGGVSCSALRRRRILSHGGSPLPPATAPDQAYCPGKDWALAYSRLRWHAGAPISLPGPSGGQAVAPISLSHQEACGLAGPKITPCRRLTPCDQEPSSATTIPVEAFSPGVAFGMLFSSSQTPASLLMTSIWPRQLVRESPGDLIWLHMLSRSATFARMPALRPFGGAAAGSVFSA